MAQLRNARARDTKEVVCAKMIMSLLQALNLLAECVGDEIWSVEVCRRHGVPEEWIGELADCFESGFVTDNQTIYEQNEVVNQYHGVRDLDLAFKIAELFGINAPQATSLAIGRRAQLVAIREAIEER